MLKVEQLQQFLREGLTKYKDRRWLVKYCQIPLSLLEILAQDADTAIRLEVVKRQDIPISLLEILAQDGDAIVRLEVIKNRNTPLNILKILAKDADSWVRFVANQRLQAQKMI